MSISKEQEDNIVNKILTMKPSEIIGFNNYSNEEVKFITQLIINQKRNKGFELEINNSGTKFRKIQLL